MEKEINYCRFCKEFENSSKAERSRVIWQNENFLLFPTIGCLTPGYCLFMPRKHTYSFAELTVSEIREAFYYVEKTRLEISNVFGPTIVAEHGSSSCDKGASCCSHAHWHLIPIRSDLVIKEYEDTGGKPNILIKSDELSEQAGLSYMLLSPITHLYMVWRADRFHSQFIRKVTSKILGFEWLYDWRMFPFKENMIITQQALYPRFKNSDLSTCYN